ncbi:low temperature requirement protein A [Sphingomonas sp. 1P06PA]|uniref:low temperature requirement protein A n=1 Tax=Sphingomonas sp. 1P06PA TaxID=554121 RepID=UPI0039A6E179
MKASTSLLRRDIDDERPDQDRVGFVELFFDLVFVFAVTQLSHALLDNLTPGGGLRIAILVTAVWWVWINTTWATNRLDVERLPVRFAIFAMMAAGLVLAMAIPKAFDTRGLFFAGAFVAMQLGRSLFLLCAVRGQDADQASHFRRVCVWTALSAIPWITGGFSGGETRLALWGLAILIEAAAPAIGFRVPGLGRSSLRDGGVSGEHMAERCALFVIIALGESILVTGATHADLDWSGLSFAALGTAFAGSLALWWIYFAIGARQASQRIAESGEPGRLARNAYTYLHLPIIAGIIVSAASDEIVIEHPGGAVKTAEAIAITGGAALYLLGAALFKHATAAIRFPVSHLAGIGVLGAAFVSRGWHSPLSLAMTVTAILIGVAAWEAWALRHIDPDAGAGENGIVTEPSA